MKELGIVYSFKRRKGRKRKVNPMGWAWVRSGQVCAGDHFLMKLSLGLEGDSMIQLDHSVIKSIGCVWVGVGWCSFSNETPRYGI